MQLRELVEGVQGTFIVNNLLGCCAGKNSNDYSVVRTPGLDLFILLTHVYFPNLADSQYIHPTSTHRVTSTHHLQDCEYILSAIVHSVCDLGLTICVGPESAWRRGSGSDGWIGFALDDIVLSLPCVSQMGTMFLRVHHTVDHGRQDSNH